MCFPSSKRQCAEVHCGGGGGRRGGLASEATRKMKTILIGLPREVFTTTILAVSFRWP